MESGEKTEIFELLKNVYNRMSPAKRLIYKHLDMDDLEEKLKSVKDANTKMIVTDGVFSMDGEYCPLPKIKELADKVCVLQ